MPFLDIMIIFAENLSEIDNLQQTECFLHNMQKILYKQKS